MSVFKRIEEEINNIVKTIGYDTDITLSISNRPDLGEFQINDAMKLAKTIKSRWLMDNKPPPPVLLGA